VNLSFVYPLSTNQHPDVTSNFRLSLLYGRQHAIRGLDLNVGASLLAGDMRGLQVTGLYSQIGGDLRGISLSLGPTYVQGDVMGGQWSFFPNLVQGNVGGFQYSTLFNFSGGNLGGFQASTLFNLTDGGGGFLQLSGVANAAAKGFRGAQLAAGFNYTSGKLAGLQIGLANAADETDGLQVGAINFAGAHSGLQVGVLNIVRENKGTPVGMFNYSRDTGKVDWITYFSNLSLVNTGVRTTVNHFYSMLTVGGYDVEENIENTAFLSWHYGYEYPVARTWSLGLDLGFVHIMPKTSDDPDVNDRLRYAVQIRAIAEVCLSPKVAFFAGGGVSDIFSEYSSKAKGEVKPLVVAGISAF
jgi:hypothetical protein